MSFSEFMNETVMPFLDDRREVRVVATRDGKPLHCELFHADTPRGTVYIIHGFTENAVKYSELIYNFLIRSVSVCIYEQRGHGRSFRIVKDKTLTHIDRFEQYVDDFEDVMEATSDAIQPYYLFSHSMGCAVAGLYLEKGGDDFLKAVMSSPMIAPTHGGYPLWATKAICRAAMALGKKRKRIFAASPYPGKEEFSSSCATDEERFSYFEAIKRGNEDFHNYSPTYEWLYESLCVTKKLLAEGAVERISVPVLIFSAELDDVVLPEPQREFASRLGTGMITEVAGAKHEIYLSKDEVTKPYFETIADFYEI